MDIASQQRAAASRWIGMSGRFAAWCAWAVAPEAGSGQQSEGSSRWSPLPLWCL